MQFSEKTAFPGFDTLLLALLLFENIVETRMVWQGLE